MAAQKTHIAKRKSHRCDECGRQIPVGVRYWATEGGEHRSHTNCLDFEDQPVLPAGFNQNRSKS